MIRKFIYLVLIGFSLIWAALKIVERLRGHAFDWVSYLPGELAALATGANFAVPHQTLNIVAWICVGLTGIFYLIGMINIFRQAGKNPWRAVLFTISAFVVALGLVFLQDAELSGLIDQSSLNLIAIMTLPFVPALLVLPFSTIFTDYFAAKVK